MPVIINELDVIAPPQQPADQQPQTQAAPVKAAGPTPRDVYWVTRKLLERRLRLQAR